VDFGIGGADRDCHGSEPLAARLKADPGSPQAVADGDLHPVQKRQSSHFVAAGEHIRPIVEILSSISEDLPFAGGPGRGVDTADALEGHRPQGEGIVVLEVLRAEAGQAAQIVQGAHLVGVDPGAVEPLPIEWRIMVGMGYSPLQPLQLQGSQFLAGCQDRHE